MEADQVAHPVARRPGGRSALVRAAVLAATVRELTEYGYTGMSAARIAERAGVNRTTIHRRWPDLEDLVAEALIERATDHIPMPDTGTIHGDLRMLLREIASYIDTAETRSRIRTLVGDAARSPAISAVLRRIFTTRFHQGEQVVARAVDRGELRGDIPAATIFAAFTGPLYVRLLITDQRLDDDFIDAVLDIGLRGAQA